MKYTKRKNLRICKPIFKRHQYQSINPAYLKTLNSLSLLLIQNRYKIKHSIKCKMTLWKLKRPMDNPWQTKCHLKSVRILEWVLKVWIDENKDPKIVVQIEAQIEAEVKVTLRVWTRVSTNIEVKAGVNCLKAAKIHN